jgi:Fic family protein
MTWNWQRADWPDFRWDAKVIEQYETSFQQGSGVNIGAARHLDEEDKKELIVSLMTDEAIKTSEIEGEILNRDSVQSSIRRNFGLETDNRRLPPAESGIADMMTDLYRHHGELLSHEILFRWHKMVTRGRRDLHDIGRYRTHEEPMQVVSGAVHQPRIHFEAPPSVDMDTQMSAFLAWFKSSGPGAENTVPPLTRAGIAHLYFVCIHPFEDGNGRIGRAVIEKALAECLGEPSMIALSKTIEKGRKAYYQALERNNKDMEITDWLVYFAETVLNAQNQSLRMIDFLIEKTKLYDRVRGQLNRRQEKVIERMFREGLEGFKGGLSAENYLSITRTSRATATRDLTSLVEKGVFTKTGVLKGTRYHLNIKSRQIILA